MARKKKEPIIYTKGDQAAITSLDGRHLKRHYSVKQRELKDGKIILELSPKTKEEKERTELIETVSEKLKDNVDAKALMEDILMDATLEKLRKLDVALKRGAKVKSREGCFFLEVKDPRRKKPMNIQIRN